MREKTPSQENLSIVFCGPVDRPDGSFPGTAAAAARLRELLPKAELILATWQGACIDNQLASIAEDILELQDPGAMTMRKISGSEFVVNFRRLVHAGLEAVRVATRPWVWRIRCDCFVADARALVVYEHASAEFRPNDFSIFRAPILIPTIFTRNPRRGGRIGHPSDLMHLGRREDILSLFQAAREGPFYKEALGPDEGAELSPEQMIWQSALRRFRPKQTWSNVAFPRPSLLLAQERAMNGNFLLADFEQLGARFKKNFLGRDSPENCFTSSEFARLRRQSWLNPTPFAVNLLARTTWYFLANVFRVKIVPLIFDWSPEGRRYKSGLVRGLCQKFKRCLGALILSQSISFLP